MIRHYKSPQVFHNSNTEKSGRLSNKWPQLLLLAMTVTVVAAVAKTLLCKVSVSVPKVKSWEMSV